MSERLKQNQISLVQFLMPSSSSRSFGTSSLDEDAQHLIHLLRYINNDEEMKCKGKDGKIERKRIILLGHSTGCQDILWTLTQRYQEISNLEGIKIILAILQAPVSDRDYFLEIASSPSFISLGDGLKWANSLLSSDDHNRIYYQKPLFNSQVPVTAYRLKSLLNRL